MWFDFGDDWWHQFTVEAINMDAITEDAVVDFLPAGTFFKVMMRLPEAVMYGIRGISLSRWSS
ncbi:MAG: hypothetical protein K8T25_19940 [Planctomycetia bacterium]|nr:hypothetical protein [Planctomycetia bacterium]